VFWLAAIAAGLHALASVAIGLYSVGQLHLLIRSRRAHHDAPRPFELPSVLVQLPLRNERRVTRALLHAVSRLEWPRDRLEVQVLDDSDDETVAICAEECARLRAGGLDIHHVRRGTRAGYKAGALAHGLTLSDAPFVAILDADFRPTPGFLRDAMAPLLADPSLGLLQGRWAHQNRDVSLFTRAQAFHLDAHFSIEQAARSRAPLFMGFNGTAGVWRRAAIDDAGGWSADSLTEDLDLSFRAQLTGWRLAYDDALAVPSELPEDVPAIRTQQHRWMKGGAQVARKLLCRLWASRVPLITKLQGTLHLAGGSVFFAVLALCVLTPLVHPIGVAWPALGAVLAVSGLALQFALLVLVAFYGTMCVRRDGGRAPGRFLVGFVPFLSLSTGLSLHNALAVLEGWFGRETPFVRTPKRGEGAADGALYLPLPVGPVAWGEAALAGWGALGFAWAVANGQWVLASFLASQTAGFAVVASGGWSPRSEPSATTERAA
jgi:cellulose synthase/poly-beta-1,6-N-acetylglucosamine synthase-like glycosyltransferase